MKKRKYLTFFWKIFHYNYPTGKVDEVVMKMLKEAYAKAVTYIRENMDILDEAAQFLIKRETITGKEFMEIFNK